MNTSFDSIALSLQFISCAFMAGVIAVIQLIHYPSFVHINKDQFSEFHTKHTSALGFIAGPVMVVELVSAIWLAKGGQSGWIANLFAVLFLWYLTFFVSVPAHNILASGFKETAWKKLVITNWPRTAFWCIRAIIFSVWLLILNKATL